MVPLPQLVPEPLMAMIVFLAVTVPPGMENVCPLTVKELLLLNVTLMSWVTALPALRRPPPCPEVLLPLMVLLVMVKLLGPVIHFFTHPPPGPPPQHCCKRPNAPAPRCPIPY